jgi:hypothetical protein
VYSGCTALVIGSALPKRKRPPVVVSNDFVALPIVYSYRILSTSALRVWYEFAALPLSSVNSKRLSTAALAIA